MPTKRQPAASEPPKRRPSGARRRASLSPSASVESSASFVERLMKNETPRPSARPPIVGANEKRELILAHAAMRRTRDPVQLMSLWAGVVTTFLVVVSAWWWASKPGYIRILSASPTEGFESVQHDAANLHQDLVTKTQVTKPLLTDLRQTASRLDALTAAAIQNQTTLDRLAAAVSASSSASNLFATPSTTTSPTN